jgi:DNA replication protein DnaC
MSAQLRSVSGDGAAATCPVGVCDGSGWIEVNETTSRRCECRAVRTREAATRRLWAGMPKRFRGVSLERKPICDISDEAMRDLRTYLADVGARLDAGEGLWLHGPNGTGKTSIAMLVAREAIKAGRSVAAYSLPALLGRIRATFDAEHGTPYLTLFERLTSIDLLVLDDLGAERHTEWVLEQLYAIVNERWAEERAVVITTNLRDFELEAQLGQRTVSRLAESCATQIWIDGPDLRYEAQTRPTEVTTHREERLR